MKKKRLFLIAFTLILCIPTVVLADPSYTLVHDVSLNIIRVMKWFGYAIALGAFILMGIKYVISPANEKANIKGKLILFFIGMFLVVMSRIIAQFFAEDIANGDRKNSATGIVQTGMEIGGLKEQK